MIMSESNLTDKISETITNVFKKTEVFEKIERIQIYISSFVIVSDIFSVILILESFIIIIYKIDWCV